MGSLWTCQIFRVRKTMGCFPYLVFWILGVGIDGTSALYSSSLIATAGAESGRKEYTSTTDLLLSSSLLGDSALAGRGWDKNFCWCDGRESKCRLGRSIPPASPNAVHSFSLFLFTLTVLPLRSMSNDPLGKTLVTKYSPSHLSLISHSRPKTSVNRDKQTDLVGADPPLLFCLVFVLRFCLFQRMFVDHVTG